MAKKAAAKVAKKAVTKLPKKLWVVCTTTLTGVWHYSDSHYHSNVGYSLEWSEGSIPLRDCGDYAVSEPDSPERLAPDWKGRVKPVISMLVALGVEVHTVVVNEPTVPIPDDYL